MKAKYVQLYTFMPEITVFHFDFPRNKFFFKAKVSWYIKFILNIYNNKKNKQTTVRKSNPDAYNRNSEKYVQECSSLLWCLVVVVLDVVVFRSIILSCVSVSGRCFCQLYSVIFRNQKCMKSSRNFEDVLTWKWSDCHGKAKVQMNFLSCIYIKNVSHSDRVWQQKLWVFFVFGNSVIQK